MALAGPHNYVWLDNMSIDQDDAHDIAAQVAVMGDIYSKAETVSVLLPESDHKAFEILARVLPSARTLVDEKWKLKYHGGTMKHELRQSDGSWKSAPKEDHVGPETSVLAKGFFEDIRQLLQGLGEYAYFQRAWTFQEWSLAHDIEIAVDRSTEVSTATTTIPTLRNVKSYIVYVALMMADYKLRLSDYVLVDSGLNRGDVVQRINEIRRLFPMEDVCLSYDEVDDFELTLQTALPGVMGTHAMLGLASSPRVPRDDTQRFRVRLSSMLDAFAPSGQIRQARYDADLVACWATMCNIPYAYSKNDSLAHALIKVVRKLRDMGVRLFNFQVNEKTHSEVDFKFFQYATAHAQSNAANTSNPADIPGAPIFTGRASTLRHIMYGIAPPDQFESRISIDDVGVEGCDGIAIRHVQRTLVMSSILLADLSGVQDGLRMATSGAADGVCFYDIATRVRDMLMQVPTTWLLAKRFVTVAIYTDSTRFFAWALCPASMRPRQLIVAREETNGTLVLAALCSETSPSGEELTASIIVAYLTISDHQCDTFLIPTDEEGNLEVIFKTPKRRDILNGYTQHDRRLRTQVTLDSRVIPPSAKTLTHTEHFVGTQTNLQAVEDCTTSRQAINTVLREFENRLEKSEREPQSLRIGPLDIDIGHPELEARALAASSRLRIDPKEDRTEWPLNLFE